MVLYKQKNTIHISSKVVKHNDKLAIFSLLFMSDDDVFELPNNRITSENKLTDNYISIKIIESALNKIAAAKGNNIPVTVFMHLADTATVFEWEEEYKKLPGSFKNLESYSNIIKIVKSNNIDLVLVGDSSVLGSINS